MTLVSWKLKLHKYVYMKRHVFVRLKYCVSLMSVFSVPFEIMQFVIWYMKIVVKY